VGKGGSLLVYPDIIAFCLDQSNIEKNYMDIQSVVITEENIFCQFQLLFLGKYYAIDKLSEKHLYLAW